eukprot:2247368-Prymnesium_polylepis.2
MARQTIGTCGHGCCGIEGIAGVRGRVEGDTEGDTIWHLCCERSEQLELNEDEDFRVAHVLRELREVSQVVAAATRCGH